MLRSNGGTYLYDGKQKDSRWSVISSLNTTVRHFILPPLLSLWNKLMFSLSLLRGTRTGDGPGWRQRRFGLRLLSLL